MIRRLLKRMRFMREHRWTHAHLSAYLDQELADDERARVEDHVGICPQCRRVLATLRQALERLRDLPMRTQPDVAEGIIERLRADG